MIHMTLSTFGGQHGLVVKRPPGNQEVGGSNPTTGKNENWTLGSPPAQNVPQLFSRTEMADQLNNAELGL